MRIQNSVWVVLLGAFCSISVDAQSLRQFNVHLGGGVGVPVGRTADFAGVSGTFQIGAGPNLSKHSSIVGEFMWHGLPPTRDTLLPVVNVLCAIGAVNPSPVCSGASLSATTNLYALAANYMYHREGRRYGAYVIGGGGWYYRHAQLKDVTIPAGTVCAPAWEWWGYTCVESSANILATRGVSSGGVNGGAGITINLGNGGSYGRFYIEARYHYSPQGGRVSTQILPVTMGWRW